ncbi:hypothetical protein LguiB_030843 [Lonicera macranthoides]
MIYDVNSPLFRSFLSQKGGASDKRVRFSLGQCSYSQSPPLLLASPNIIDVLPKRKKTEEQKPKEQRPKASENKPVMNE